MNKIKIECPKIDVNVDFRKRALRESIEKWIYSDSLIKLVGIFGGKYTEGLNFYDTITFLNDFVEIWDYRKKKALSVERWAVNDDEMSLKYAEVIFQVSENLGLMGEEKPTEIPDYILPLGGARLTNYARPMLAKKILDINSNKAIRVIALTGKRPINEIETPYLEEYAPNATTEYEAMCSGMEKTFGIVNSDYLETIFFTENINKQWSIREYNKKYLDANICVLAAPSADESRRANSYDTFNFFLNKFNISEGSKLLLVTSGIYVPFQLLKFIPIALEKNIYVDCIGLDNSQQGTSFSKPSNYCQEIKATINAIKTLADLYWQK